MPSQKASGFLLQCVTLKAPFSEDLLVSAVSLHRIKSFLDGIMHICFALAGCNASHNFVEGFASNIEHLTRFLQKESGTFQCRAIGVNLRNLKSLARIGVLGEYNNSCLRLSGVFELFVLVLKQPLNRCAVFNRDLQA